MAGGSGQRRVAVKGKPWNEHCQDRYYADHRGARVAEIVYFCVTGTLRRRPANQRRAGRPGKAILALPDVKNLFCQLFCGCLLGSSRGGLGASARAGVCGLPRGYPVPGAAGAAPGCSPARRPGRFARASGRQPRSPPILPGTTCWRRGAAGRSASATSSSMPRPGRFTLMRYLFAAGARPCPTILSRCAGTSTAAYSFSRGCSTSKAPTRPITTPLRTGS